MRNGPVNARRVRVRSHQTDLNGAMYHGAYFDVFDDARIDTFRDLDYTYGRVLEEGWSLVIRRVECEFFKPAFMDDAMVVTVNVERMRPASMTIQYECRRGVELLARGRVTYAFLDASGKVTRLPADLRALIERTPNLQVHADLLPETRKEGASAEAP